MNKLLIYGWWCLNLKWVVQFQAVEYVQIKTKLLVLFERILQTSDGTSKKLNINSDEE